MTSGWRGSRRLPGYRTSSMALGSWLDACLARNGMNPDDLVQKRWRLFIDGRTIPLARYIWYFLSWAAAGVPATTATLPAVNLVVKERWRRPSRLLSVGERGQKAAQVDDPTFSSGGPPVMAYICLVDFNNPRVCSPIDPAKWLQKGTSS
jgi:hypothetical protein